MNIRTRLLLGYAYLVLLLLLAAGGSSFGFYQLQRATQSIVGTNFALSSAAAQLLESLAEHERVTLDHLLGNVPPATMRRADEELMEHLGAAEAIAADTDARASVADVGHHLERYLAARARLDERDVPDLRAAFDREVSPPLDAAANALRAILSDARARMLEAQRDTRDLANQVTVGLALLVALALMSMGFLSIALQRHVLGRLATLKATTEAIAAGDTIRRFETSRNDELSAIALQLNRALDAQSTVQSTMEGRVAHHRQLVLGLLGHPAGQIATLFGINGEVLAATTEDPAHTAAFEELGAWIVRDGRARAADYLESAAATHHRSRAIAARIVTRDDGSRIRVDLLTVPGTSRPVGWLATLEPPAAPPSGSGSHPSV